MSRIGEISPCALRILVGILLLLAIGSAVCIVIGVGILINTDEQHDARVGLYDSNVQKFVNGYPLLNMQGSSGVVLPPINNSSSAPITDAPAPAPVPTGTGENTTSDNMTTTSSSSAATVQTTSATSAPAQETPTTTTAAAAGGPTRNPVVVDVEVKLVPDPSEQPLPKIAGALPSGPGIVDYSISIPLSSNRSSSSSSSSSYGGSGVARTRFSGSHLSVPVSEGGGSVAALTAMAHRRMQQEREAAAASASSSSWLLSRMGFTMSTASSQSSTAEIAPTLMPDIILTLTDSFGVQSNITLPPLLQPKRSLSSTTCRGNNDGFCNQTTMARLCREQSGCSNAVYNGPPCDIGKACTGCSTLMYQSTMCLVLSHNNKTGFGLAKGGVKSCLYPFKAENQPIACSSSEADTDYVHVMLFDERDPFVLAQNMTHGTMLFPGYSAESQRSIGLALSCGGAGLLLICIGVWYASRLAMRDDNPAKRHFYGAFWQTYIPSPREMAYSVQAGTSGKYDGGFKPKSAAAAGKKASGNEPRAVAASTSSTGSSSSNQSRSGDESSTGNNLEEQMMTVKPTASAAALRPTFAGTSSSSVIAQAAAAPAFRPASSGTPRSSVTFASPLQQQQQQQQAPKADEETQNRRFRMMAEDF